jgi:hypothetical protein
VCIGKKNRFSGEIEQVPSESVFSILLICRMRFLSKLFDWIFI